MTAQKEIEYVTSVFPEINIIQDTKLREQVTQAWIEAWQTSSYSRIEDAVFSLTMPSLKLHEHIRGVVKIAMAIIDILANVHMISINSDLVIAGALLHDIDKIVLYEKSENNGTYSLSKHYERFPHGYIGARIAHSIGLPQDIEHIILSHTSRKIIAPQTLEAIIINYADFADYDVLAYSSGAPLLLHRH